jgi:methylated-DNA-[protein]-cysteine S-methyltransferase
MIHVYTLLATKLGWMGLVGTRKGIGRIYLPMDQKKWVRDLVQTNFSEIVEDPGFFTNEIAQVQDYFQGQRKKFQFSLDFSGATAFQRQVYETLLTIPFGEVRTYAWVAQKIGNPRALRAVGNANGKNKWPLVVPCHRVVGSNGGLTGFSASGGLDLKAKLLLHEGIETENQRIVHDGKVPGGQVAKDPSIPRDDSAYTR